jgi:hypothetical protein
MKRPPWTPRPAVHPLHLGHDREAEGHPAHDDIMLVSGHNISTTEVESALVSHPKVAEAAVVGATDRRPAKPWSRS